MLLSGAPIVVICCAILVLAVTVSASDTVREVNDRIAELSKGSGKEDDGLTAEFAKYFDEHVSHIDILFILGNWGCINLNCFNL
jgi:hypothetical protein